MMKRTLSGMTEKVSNKIELGVNSVTRSYNKIGGWRSIPSIVGLVSLLIGVPVAFALGAFGIEACAMILVSSITIGLASTLTNCLIGLVDNGMKKRYENTLGNQHFSNLTPGTNSDILAASISANFSGETRTSQNAPATGVNSTLGLNSLCLK